MYVYIQVYNLVCVCVPHAYPTNDVGKKDSISPTTTSLMKVSPVLGEISQWRDRSRGDIWLPSGRRSSFRKLHAMNWSVPDTWTRDARHICLLPLGMTQQRQRFVYKKKKNHGDDSWGHYIKVGGQVWSMYGSMCDDGMGWEGEGWPKQGQRISHHDCYNTHTHTHTCISPIIYTHLYIYIYCLSKHVMTHPSHHICNITSLNVCTIVSHTWEGVTHGSIYVCVCVCVCVTS